jgi:hypothetical protein
MGAPSKNIMGGTLSSTMLWDQIPAAPITYSIGNLSTCHTNIMDNINIRITIDKDAPIDEYLVDEYINCYITLDDGTYQVIIEDIAETLLDTLNPDELCEFLGIDSEFVIATEVLEFA